MRRFLILALGGLLLGASAFALSGFRSDGAEDAAPATTVISPTTTVISPTTTSTPATTTVISPATTGTPPTTTSSGPPRGTLVVNATGDVNTDISYIPALAAEGHGYAWSGLNGLFLEDDLTIINLECSPSDLGTAANKTFIFRCDLPSLPVMKDAGVDVVNLGNNHSQDYGKEALIDGRAQAEAAGLNPVGAGSDAAEAAAPALFEINGWKVAVLGFGGVFPSTDWFATDENPGMANGDDAESMASAVRAADELADLVIVTIHWGVELDLEPTAGDRALAQAVIDAGADMIFGHHPHRLQPLEVVDGVPVAWSLGNFVWPNFSVPGSTTAVAQVIVSPDGSMTSCLLPAFITAPGHPELTGDDHCGAADRP